MRALFNYLKDCVAFASNAAFLFWHQCSFLIPEVNRFGVCDACLIGGGERLVATLADNMAV